MNHTIKIGITLSSQNIDDIVCTALEGGINYWASSAEVKDGDCKGATYASEVISRGGTLIIKEDQDGKLHELTLDNFKKGVELYGVPGIADDHDAWDADSIVQYALFGRLIYG
jgi:hypothetical protein